MDWFPPAEAYLKRTLIQRLIFELVEDHSSHEVFSSDYSDDHHHSENNENRAGVQCPEINGESSTSHAGQGIEITLLSASSSLDPQSFNNSGVVLKELFEPGATAGTLLGHCQSFDRQSSDHRLNDSIFSMEVSTRVVFLSALACFLLKFFELLSSGHVIPSARMFYVHSLFPHLT